MLVQRTLALLAALTLTWISASASANDESSTNIVIIFADDLGYGDVSCYGATKIKTPNIDSLARGGMMFTDAHAAASICSPSRYGLLTGDSPWRLHRKGNGYRVSGDRMLRHERQTSLASRIQIPHTPQQQSSGAHPFSKPDTCRGSSGQRFDA
jgi:Sulfatase